VIYFFFAYLVSILKLDKYRLITSQIFTILVLDDRNITFLLNTPNIKNNLKILILFDNVLLCPKLSTLKVLSFSKIHLGAYLLYLASIILALNSARWFILDLMYLLSSSEFIFLINKDSL